MTCIAWDGKTLAADKRTSFGGASVTTTKIHRVNGSLVGCAGITAQIAEMIVWLRGGAEPKDFPAPQRDSKECVSMLVIRPDGQVVQYENTPYPIVIESRIWSIGSGRDFALAAMHLGKSAKDAVQLACDLDMNCGNGIDTLELEP